jgi:hypothetical protein
MPARLQTVCVHAIFLRRYAMKPAKEAEDHHPLSDGTRKILVEYRTKTA